METWRAGRRVLLEKAYGGASPPIPSSRRADKTPIRVSGTAVLITPSWTEGSGRASAQSQT